MPVRSRTRLTKRIVDEMPPGQTIWDSEVRGFGVRRQLVDRSYVVKCRVNRRQIFITLGKHGAPLTVEQARKKALITLAKLLNGDTPSPQDDHDPDELSVKGFCDRYLSDHAEQHKKPRSISSDRSLIRNHIIPLLGDLRISAVTRLHIESLRNDVLVGKTAPIDPKAKQLSQKGGQPVRGGPGVANRCLTLLSKMFNLAEDWELRPQNSNPVRRIKRYREQRRERFLSNVEIKKVGQAISQLELKGSLSFSAASLLRLLLLTGARVGEMTTLQWSYVYLDKAILALPDSKTGRKIIRLCKPALSILESMPAINDSPFVFPGQSPERHIVNIQKPWKRVCKTAGIGNVRIHDIRHTFASVAAGQGTSLLTIGALLGHNSPATTSRYAHLGNDHVASANESIGNELHELLEAPQEFISS